MRLARPPSRGDLESAYSRLLWRDDEEPTAEELVLWSQWARIDPRLAEILVACLLRRFRALSALSLWEENRKSAMPAALAALVDFARLDAKRVLPPPERIAFAAWAKTVLWRVPSAPPQLFFLRQGKPRPERDIKEIGQSLRVFRRWGFFGSAAPLDEKHDRRATMLDPCQRRQLLRKLARGGETFTVADYMSACGGRVHRRTAERDLKEWPALRRIGATKAARYQRRKGGA